MPTRPPLPTLVLAEDLGETPNRPMGDRVRWFAGAPVPVPDAPRPARTPPPAPAREPRES